MALPNVHSSGGVKVVAGRRDPQLMVDPARLPYDDRGLPLSPLSPRSNQPYDYDPAFVAAAVNPNVVYSNGRAVYVPTDPVAVVREQYCICAPKTGTERRLMVIVVVLAVISLSLLITLVTLLPNILSSTECGEGSSKDCGGLFDFLQARFEALMT